jgi:RND family efflux transporter MFP subunit
LIGVRTVAARHEVLAPEIRASATVTYDETRQAEINTRVDGWIKDLMADYTGRPIRRGEALLTLYSPDILATQNEFLLAQRGQEHAGHAPSEEFRQYAERIVAAARERLIRLEMTPEEIDALEKSGRAVDTITFRSPVSGVIVEKAALRGMRVMAGQMLYRVVDLSSVWVEAQVYENDLANVRTGAAATVTVQGYPEKTFTGRVTYIYPTVTEQTRTIRVRVALPNPGLLLKPNMLATVTIQAPQSHALVVPADAVVDTGTQQLVFIADGDGRFTPRTVRVGHRGAGNVEIVSGLEDGELVASGATFFVDSESQLRGALQNYLPPATAEAGSAAHAGHETSAVAITFGTEPNPATTGDVTLMVTVKDAAGTPVADANVSVVLFMPAMPSMNMPAMKTDARLLALGNGTYRGTAQIMTPGRWDVTVAVARGGQSLATRQFAVVAR